jgi:5'-nucleotidase/UDP-sugar diphosphatase
MNTKRFTILHNNDMHGDFLAETGQVNNEMIGGLSLLSGYINQVRRTEKNVIYAIAGDMVQGFPSLTRNIKASAPLKS